MNTKNVIFSGKYAIFDSKLENSTIGREKSGLEDLFSGLCFCGILCPAYASQVGLEAFGTPCVCVCYMQIILTGMLSDCLCYCNTNSQL